jgi:hypothetical protein
MMPNIAGSRCCRALWWERATRESLVCYVLLNYMCRYSPSIYKTTGLDAKWHVVAKLWYRLLRKSGLSDLGTKYVTSALNAVPRFRRAIIVFTRRCTPNHVSVYNECIYVHVRGGQRLIRTWHFDNQDVLYLANSVSENVMYPWMN